MAGQNNDIAKQLASNQVQGSMVLVFVIAVTITVIDRVLYSSHVFMQQQDKIVEDTEDKKRGTDETVENSVTLAGHDS